jgi:hypothetical protein
VWLLAHAVLLGFGVVVIRRSDYPLSEDLTTPKPGRALGLREVVAFALKTELPSLAVIRRLGFDYERELLLESGKHALYRRRA